jgi:hypothetical protein
MATCIGDCIVRFTRTDLEVENGFTSPEEFADAIARDLQMAVSRQVTQWRNHPQYGDTNIVVWLDDVTESEDDGWEDQEFEAIIQVMIQYPNGVDVVPIVAAAVEEITGCQLRNDPGDPEVGSDGFGDFEP